MDPDGERRTSELYATFTGETCNYAALVHRKKREILTTSLAAETERLANLLAALAASLAGGVQFSRADLADALIEVMVYFPVYRSYIAPDRKALSVADVAHVEFAIHLSCERRPDLPLEIFALIRGMLVKPKLNRKAREFIYRFQQLTGPAMAKGEEDTAFFCFNRLISANEVGGDPAGFGVRPEAFQTFCQQLHQNWPATMLSSSTHDTKRSEDVRARLALLTEIPDEWARTVRHWSSLTARHRRDELPDRNTEYLFYQTVAGAWPIALDRVTAFMEKAVREAKQHTNWIKPSQPYEKTLNHFVSEALRDPDFTTEVERFVGALTDAGYINSLGQTLVKLTGPGVPDIYQGCDLWNFSLVDPDNRRPVDFPLRQRLLARAKMISCEQAWLERHDGLAKLWMLRRVLSLRSRQPQLFAGPVELLPARGAKANHVVAFLSGNELITIVPRFLMKLKNDWADTTLSLPAGNWHNEFTSEVLSGTLNAAAFFQKFPVALLTRKERKQ